MGRACGEGWLGEGDVRRKHRWGLGCVWRGSEPGNRNGLTQRSGSNAGCGSRAGLILSSLASSGSRTLGSWGPQSGPEHTREVKARVMAQGLG